ncbi:hypothetical protein EVAR_38021_1 [Eumeta japonica]|uniref:Uncharacterized protein n=1 Tax=Eumeta variegata TaxID=151549 RepID=A0A4C1WW71_EUMVA|nr:hypothetical protein EVAR_38021_1 [Eumeta japonica]
MTDGRLQTGLIWRKEDIDIPNNRNIVLFRLCNGKKLKPEEKLKDETGKERVFPCNSTPAGDVREVVPKIENHSSWLRLVRATGRVLQFVDLCRRRESSYAANHK